MLLELRRITVPPGQRVILENACEKARYWGATASCENFGNGCTRRHNVRAQT
jgi:hypothetical protein